MEDLSVATSISSVLQLAGNVVGYLNDLKDSSTACGKILVEIASINSLLSRVMDLADEAKSGGVWSMIASSLSVPNGPVAQFKIALEQVATRLKPVVGLKTAGKALFWPFDKREVMDILYTIERQKTIFRLATQNDHRGLSRIIRSNLKYVEDRLHQTESLDTLWSELEDQEVPLRSQENRDIVTWLSPLDFWTKQKDVFSRWQKGTGKWLLEADLFKAWLSGTQTRRLWCPGIPGAGKTTLASVVINYLEQTFTDDVAVAYIYCDYKERNHTALNLVASLLQQLIQQHFTISNDITTIYRQYSRKGTRPPLAEYSTLLQSEARCFSRVFIIIDALDECLEVGDIEGFLSEIRKLPPNTYTLVTSRYIRNIEFEKMTRLEICARDEDIKSYAEARIDEQPQLVRHINMDPTLRGTILDTVVRKACGMYAVMKRPSLERITEFSNIFYRFLLAQLHMDSLAREKSRRGVRRALQVLPKEINQIYDEAVERIQSQPYERVKAAIHVLSWISHAARALTIRELRYAIAVECGDEDMDEDAVPGEGILVSACAGLITIDQGSNIIRLVHYTAQEYFERTRIDLLSAARTEIARTCLTYLSFDMFADGYCLSDEEMETRLRKSPLLHYAAHNWGYHVRRGAEQDQVITNSVLNFLSREPHVSCSIQVRCMPPYRFKGYTQQFPKDVSGLQVAASFGLKEIVKILIENGADTKTKDSNKATPLHNAASHGYEEVVEVLLEKGADIEAKENNGMTALHWAASNGHGAVVQKLLGRGADANVKTELGETPLYRAAWNGHKTVVRQLLEVGAEPDLRDIKYGLTPLSRAKGEGHMAVVRLLLEYGADPESREAGHGQTPLSRAAKKGQKGADPDSKDVYGRTPLGYATLSGHESVARLLLERNDVDPQSTDDWGQTPLSRAMENGHGAIVRLPTQVTSEDLDGHSAQQLLRAAESGDEAEVRLLLKESGEIVNTRASNGQTPLSEASRKGHHAVVQLLLEQDGIDLESKCMYGRTPLSWAAGNGHDTVVRLLLKTGVEPDSKSCNGRTPLSWAAGEGYEAVVGLLLERRDVEVNSQDAEFYQTPLLRAVEAGHLAVTRVLVENGADIDSVSAGGNTALSLASHHGHGLIVQLLKSKIEAKDTAMEKPESCLCQVRFGQGPELGAHTLSHQPNRQMKPMDVLRSYDKVDPRFLPLPFDHPKSAVWRESIFPWIRSNYKDILGTGNVGSIEILSDQNVPTVCVTARSPERVNQDLLRSQTESLGVPILIKEGEIHRSCGVSCWPTIGGQYAVRPNCGASLGVAEGIFEKNRVSLGGYVKLLFDGQRQWEWCGLTCHHLLQLNGGYSSSKQKRQDKRVVDVGFDIGKVTQRGTRPKALEIQSPHQVDFDNVLSRLKERSDMCKRDKNYARLDVVPTDRIEFLEAADLRFGSVNWSSGLCIHDRLGVQMDWLLIGGTSSTRVGFNSVGDSSDFMEVSSANPSSPSTDYITDELFDALIRSCSELAKLCPGQVGGLSRIHGRGCESGLRDGYLSSNQVCVVLEDTKASFEWAFTPRDRNGLGMAGDSGAWIFLENANHHALGQIWGHNPTTNTTFYTPLYAIFEHIKETTGALDVQLLSKDDYRNLRLDGDLNGGHQSSNGKDTHGTFLQGKPLQILNAQISAGPDGCPLHQVDSGYFSSQP